MRLTKIHKMISCTLWFLWWYLFSFSQINTRLLLRMHRLVLSWLLRQSAILLRSHFSGDCNYIWSNWILTVILHILFSFFAYFGLFVNVFVFSLTWSPLLEARFFGSFGCGSWKLRGWVQLTLTGDLGQLGIHYLYWLKKIIYFASLMSSHIKI